MTTILSEACVGIESAILRRLAFASCYVYSPAGFGTVCERSRLLCSLLKEGDMHFMVRYALRVHQQVDGPTLLAGFFRSSDILIPVPGCAAKSGGRTWVAAELARALVSEGLGRASWTGLHRTVSVHKSATAAVGKRPSVRTHFDSFAVEGRVESPGSIVLIDDVVTKGRTLLAAASRLREAFPESQIRAFALLRTMGFEVGVQQLLDPCRGEIRWAGGDARRRP
jgi:hypothetical protein